MCCPRSWGGESQPRSYATPPSQAHGKPVTASAIGYQSGPSSGLAIATITPAMPGTSAGLDSPFSNMYSNAVHIFKSPTMPRQATYTYVRENLARLLEEVEVNRDVVIINRRGHEDVALVPAGELESLVETA